MAEVINLNRFRKQRERAGARKVAAENRIRFGRDKEDRAKDRDESQRNAKELDDKRLD
jgi:hypothetical protein